MVVKAAPYLNKVKDPLAIGRILWPKVQFYKKERDLIYSVWENDETICPAGHMLGKDFTAAFICLVFFLTRHPCRIVTTSVDFDQLDGVLWGEIRNFINTSKYPLSSEQGGPLLLNHLHIRKVMRGEVCGLSYLTGRVAEKGEGMSGHHIAATGDGIPRTLFVADEASGVDQTTIEKASEWHNRMLLIGNPYDCDTYFRYAVEGEPRKVDDEGRPHDLGGDIPRENGKGYTRKIIHIEAEDSPNVRFAQAQIEAGIEPTDEIILPGVLPYGMYKSRLAKWDIVKRTVGLHARFYKGATNRLYPQQWLSASHRYAKTLRGIRRQAKAIGVDPGEGGANTCWTAVDEYGIIEQLSMKTPDTEVIPGRTIAFGQKHQVPPHNWIFDRGGGGKQHADVLRKNGYKVRTVAFGEGIALEPRRGMISIEERKEIIEERTTYANRRAQMYGDLRIEISPKGLGANSLGDRSAMTSFGIPEELTELVRQLSLIPLMYDKDGKLYLLPKTKPPGSHKQSLTDILGASPDEADSLVLAVHGMLYQGKKTMAGAMV